MIETNAYSTWHSTNWPTNILSKRNEVEQSASMHCTPFSAWLWQTSNGHRCQSGRVPKVSRTTEFVQVRLTGFEVRLCILLLSGPIST